MGYVLPVTPYKYNNYQIRMIKHTPNIYYIGQKQRVIFQEIKREPENDAALLAKAYSKAKYSAVIPKLRQLDILLTIPIEQHKGREVNLHA